MWWRLSAPWTSCWEKSTGKVAKEKGPVIHATLEFLRTYAGPLIAAVVIVAVLPLIAGYVVLLERQGMAHFQVRLGPMRVGPHRLLPPIADALELFIKEDINSQNADGCVFSVATRTSVA